MELHGRAYEHAMERVLDELLERYSDRVSPETVASVVASGRADLERSGRHAEFIPALLKNWARDELVSIARAAGRPTAAAPKLLFVCEHNEGRSQVAAALADHLSGGRVLVRSAGLAPSGRLNPHAATVLAERGIELRVPLPSEVQDDALDAADVIVLIGCQRSELCGRRTVHWDIDDPYAQDLQTARRIADELEVQVRALLVELEIPVGARDRVAVTV